MRLFPNAVVGDGERFRAGIAGEIRVIALDGDQVVPVRFDDSQGNVQALGLLDGLIACDDPTEPVDKDGSAGPVLAERSFERCPAAVGSAIGVVGHRA